MLSFFYESLESLKKVKKPTSKEVWNLTVVILIVVIISAIMFAVFDGIFGRLGVRFYGAMTN